MHGIEIPYFVKEPRKEPFFFKPLPKRQILDSPILKEFGDDNFKLKKMAEIPPKWIENTVGKGEVARYEQLLLFPQYFQKT